MDEFGFVKEAVGQLAAFIDAVGQHKKPHFGVRSRLRLDADRAKLDRRTALGQGGFAAVYAGTYDGHPVAVKLLDMAEYAGGLKDQVCFDEVVEGGTMAHASGFKGDMANVQPASCRICAALLLPKTVRYCRHGVRCVHADWCHILSSQPLQFCTC